MKLKMKKMKLKTGKKKLDEKTKCIIANKYKYNLQQYEKVRSFANSIYNGKISMDEDDIDQNSLLDGLTDFIDRFRPKSKNSRR